MIRSLAIFIFLIFLFSCSSSPKLDRPEIKPEIPLKELNERGVTATNQNYKKNYFKILPYLFYNENDAYNEIKGDFYNVKFHSTSNLNIMTGFWSDYGQYKNSLVVLISMSETSKAPLKDVPVSVVSSKNGVFKRGELMGNYDINKTQQRVLYVKELDLEKKYEVLDKVTDDLITVTVNGHVYKFLSPELELN